MAVPITDAPLAEWSTNFQVRGTAAPTSFALTAAQMTSYTSLHNSWMTAYSAEKADGARSKALVLAKNDAKANLIPYARQLYQIVKGSPSVTNDNKALIGVHVSDREPSPVPPPAQPPLLSIISVTGRLVRCKIADANFPSSRRRPLNAEGATILSFAGANPPPSGDPGWKLEGQTGKTTFLVNFSSDVAGGTPCWVTAMWYNARGQYSPASAPVQTFLQVGSQAQAA